MLITIVAAASHGNDSPRLLYLWLLFALCSSPLVYADGFNGRYAILIALLPLYFVYYGVSDLLTLLVGGAAGSVGILDTTELAILLGGAALCVGYFVSAHRKRAAALDVKDWYHGMIFWVGLCCWILGVLATLYWQVRVQRGAFKLENVGVVLGMSVTLGRLLQPLGMTLLAYRLVKHSSWPFLLLIIGMLCVELVVGFVCDSKELAIRGVVIVMAAKLLLQGKVPKTWLLVGGLLVMVAFPVFQAYRLEVLGVRGQAREQAARNLMENVEIAIKSVTEPSAFGSQAGPGFVGRVSLKPTITMILDRVGNTAKFQNGYTYGLFFLGLVPRAMWPDKPDTSVGQLFNRELKVSQFKDVYISPSYLGECYWNFGWPGIAAGMFVIGGLLGFVGRRCALAEGATVTRFMVLALTLYDFGLRFEGGIALESLVWMRSLLIVALLHWLFARTAIVGRVVVSPSATPNNDRATIKPLLPNLMQ